MWRAIFMLNLKYVRRVWRYQREVIRIVNRRRTTQWPKEKWQKDKHRSTKYTWKLSWWCNGQQAFALRVLFPGCVNPRTWNWYLLLLWLSMQHKGQRAKIDWLWIRIICPSGATYILVKCCFSELALYKSNYSMLV
jgi:hypothetical protein